MVWYLLFAHFLSDYLFQSDWMARNKVRLPILLMHIATHLVVMSLLGLAVFSQIWPYLLLLTLIHFVIDLGKNMVFRLRPQWMIMPYVIDQLLHYVSIAWIGWRIEREVGRLSLPIQPRWIIYLTGFLVVTYVWFISERILAYANADYRQELKAQFWPRMASRALLLGAFLWIGSQAQISSALAAGAIVGVPYLSGEYRLRALMTDIGVALAVTLLLRLAI